MAEIRRYWPATVAAVAFRIILIFFSEDINLGARPEVATPLSSLRRLAEGYWLKQSSLSPYAGSMYHGSPLLLSILGPLISKRTDGLPTYFYCSLLFVLVDFISALLIRSIGKKISNSNFQNIKSSKKEEKLGKNKKIGDFASLIYLWNPLTIVTCVGFCTNPIDNFLIILTIFGAISNIAPLAAFGFIMATHFTLYPIILIIPVILLLGFGPDTPSYKKKYISWRPIISFTFWTLFWAFYVLILCNISLKGIEGLNQMFKKTYGFILKVEDLSPNIGIFWYFFAEVFEFFRDFFVIVFHVNILFIILPLAIRLKNRPVFLAFIYIALSSMLKSYPSVGDSALYLGFLGLFANELADMQLSFFLFFGYIGVILLSPVMHNLWIWRGTGNANFYFATGLAYACLQTVLIVESLTSMLKYDRILKKLNKA